jgi:hypothetical protein
MIPATDIERARAVRIEDEIARRGITLKRVGTEMIGPCPVCGVPGWAALSANGITSLIQPREAMMVMICADNDISETGQGAARVAAECFLSEGRRRIAMPQTPGSDFNDILTSSAATAMVKARHVA